MRSEIRYTFFFYKKLIFLVIIGLITLSNAYHLHENAIQHKSLADSLLNKMPQVSKHSAPWFRRWEDFPILRQRNMTEFLEAQKEKETAVKKESLFGGPPRSKHYDPNFGYEIYWADGNWVMEWFHKMAAKDESACDEKCVPMHDRFGKVCGKNKKLEEKTFETMCAMRHYDCLDDDKWVPVYRGECRPELQYPTTYTSSTMTPLPLMSMAPLHITEFEDRHPYLHFG